MLKVMHNSLTKVVQKLIYLDGVECLTEFEGFKIGRLKVHPDLGSPTQFKIASRWLHECRTSHQACLMSRIPELPTRVVDIGSPDNAVHPRLFVSKGKKADYIALSHCWGGSIDPVLTQGTYEDFQKELPVSKLAANFKDAIRIARELGIQYVWIDCLCIIQDSKEDWEIESSKMGAIYRNATLTVSALVSARSTVGILKSPENNFIGAPETAKLRMYEDSSKDGEVDVEWKSREEENLRVLMMNSALASRGWTLQEYILSPRNLLYGGRQIYWRCPSRMISADDTPEGNQFPSEVQFPNASKIIYSDILAMKPQIKADVKAVLEDYYALVQTYSARQLTFGSDKFAAFSGIAQLMHPAIGAQYIAGIWTRDFKHGLLWYKELGSCRHVESHGAPSWSWMVTDSNVLFSTRLLEATPYDVKILRYNDIPQDPTMQFGRIKSAFVVVEGLTTPLIRSKQIVHALNRDDIMLGSVFYDEPSFPDERGMLNSVIFVDDEAHGPSLVSVNAEFGNDDFNVDSAHYVEENLLILLVQADGSDEDDDMDENFGEGLILRPLKHGSEHAYERIGYVSFSGLCMAFFQGWESRKLKMI